MRTLAVPENSVWRARSTWVALAGFALAVPIGIAVGQGGTRALVVAGFAVGLASVPIARGVLFRGVRHSFLTVEVPLLLLLLGTLVFRVRSAQDIAVDPLDPAAQIRVALMVMGLALGGIALISPARPSSVVRSMTLPMRIYAIYVAVVFVGAPLSVNAPLTIYRGIELTSMLVVIAGARKSVGIDATRRIGDLLYWFGVALIGTVWAGVALFPQEAVKTFFLNREVRWNFQISGVFPEISANGVGILAVVIAVWSFTRVASGRSRPFVGYSISILAVGTLIAAQYRTGYVALVAAVGVWLWIHRRWGWLTIAAAAGTMFVLFASSTILAVAPYVLRGTAEQAAGLSGRLYWWSAAIPVWESSPLLGRGLLTGTRYEVLEPLGLTTTSSIHSTWIEALVGTGVVGVLLLVACLGLLLVWAFREAHRPGGQTTAMMLLVVLTVRSFTGSTFETFSMLAMVFLWIASSAEEWPRSRLAVPGRITSA